MHRTAALTPAICAEILRLSQSGLSPTLILTALRVSDPQTPLIVKDMGNIVQQIRARELSGQTPIQWLLAVRIRLFKTPLLTNPALGASKHQLPA